MTQSRYQRSEAMLARARRAIPLGSQTFSKSFMQYPLGAAPFFIERGRGGHVWDIDGNEYVDFVSGLHAQLLGYCDPDVDAAVTGQLALGTIFSLPSPLETEVAELIIETVPSAEMVRFGKNGSDATTGAIRLARAHTGRDRVVVGGYHGWHDWYIGSTTRNLGVPGATQALTSRFTYNDIDSLAALFRQYPGEIAAVIMEVMNVAEPRPGFLGEVIELAHRHGALVVFDEIITGFRFAAGGAQQLFGITPDLTTLGKGMANGFPLSAVVGRADIMRKLEDVFFSFTMGGECLSLAAAKAVITKIRTQPVLETMHARGRRLIEAVRTLIERHRVGHFIEIAGHPAWSFVVVKDVGRLGLWDLKTLYLQETLARNTIIGAMTHNLCYAHSDADIDRLVVVYDEVFPILKAAVEADDVRPFLRGCELLQPLFRVR